MADGGEGTLAAIAVALGDGAERRTVATTDPLGRPISADWLLLDEGRAAFVEMAAASGLARLSPAERTPANARRASTRGTGDLMRAALDAGVERITIGLGGSATTDGGSGLLRALGVRCSTATERSWPRAAQRSRTSDRIERAAWTRDSGRRDRHRIRRDEPTVRHPRSGRDVRATEGRRRGDRGGAGCGHGRMGRFIERTTGRLVADVPGAGAAGGTTAGLLGFTKAVVRPGVEVVAELVGLAGALEDVDLVITGEGRADEQTLHGKAAIGVAMLARSRGTPVVLLCGALGAGAEALDAATSIAVVQPIGDRPMDLEEAMRETGRLLGLRPGGWPEPSTSAWSSRARRRATVDGARPEPAEASSRSAKAATPRRRRPRAAGRALRAPDLGRTAGRHGQRAGPDDPVPEHRGHQLVSRLHRASCRATPTGTRCSPRRPMSWRT